MLAYEGNGVVALTLMKKTTGELYDYTMEYSKDDSGVTFKAVNHLRK